MLAHALARSGHLQHHGLGLEHATVASNYCGVLVSLPSTTLCQERILLTSTMQPLCH